MRPQTPQEKEYNRMAMTKTRAEVRKAVEGVMPEGMAHLGDYPKTMEEAVRTIIALQDLLEISMNKHGKATDLVLAQKHEIIGVVTLMNFALNDATNAQMVQSEKIGTLIKERDSLNVECQRLSDGWNEANGKVLLANIEINRLEELRDAHKMVLHSTLNEEGLG